MDCPDLLLVRPPERPGPSLGRLPPLGLLYIASAARAAGQRVGLFDAPAEGLGWGELVRRCRSAHPAVIGLGGFTPTFPAVARASVLLRPWTGAVIVGGPHVTRHTAALEQLPDVTALVVGEAEETIAPLLDWLAGDRRGAPPRGVAVRGHPLRRRARVRALDRLPTPARDLVDPRRYRYAPATRPGVATLMSSRGCPHPCTFCDKTVAGARPRLHSTPRVLDELEQIATSGAGYVVLFDDSFTAKRERALEIAEGILERGLDLRWKCEARPGEIDAALLRKLHRAGCRTVAMGVESRWRRSLQRLGKDQDPAAVRDAFRACRDAGIDTVAYALLGIPGEDPADARATAAFCREIGATWTQFSTLSPFAGTPLYREARARNWLAETTVRNPADAEDLRPTLLAPPWTETNLRRTLWRCHLDFYGHPRALLRAARATRYGGSIRGRAAASAAMGSWVLREGLRGLMEK